MSDDTGTLTWFYSAHGELIQTRQTLAGGSTFFSAYSYDAQTGLLNMTTYPSGHELYYQYDTQGRILQIDTPYQGLIESVIANVQYQPFGGVKSLDYGNGLSLNRVFDLDGRLSQQSVSGLTTVQDLSWDYNLVSSVQNLNNLLNSTLSQSFDYDELDRLNLAQTDTTLYGLLGFAYDANGNRTQQDDNSQITDYLINASNNRTDFASGAQAQKFQYDAKGNITYRNINGDTYDYQYNQQNRLSQIDKNGKLIATYHYNGLGQRTSKTLADGTLTYYLYNDAGQLISEVDTTGQVTKEYLYFDGEPLALAQYGSTNSASLVHLSSVSNNWQTVPLSLSTSEVPVIIAGVPSFNDTDPGVIALQNISSTQAEVRFKEWDYLDATHANETASLLALAPGRHTMSDGSIWEVGTFDLSGTRSFKTTNFTEAFVGTPKVFVTAQTSNDTETAAIRVKSVTSSSFRAAFNEQESLNNGHVSETVGYLAIYSPMGSGTVTLDGQELSYSLSNTSIRHDFASVQSGHSIKVEEEQSLNLEVNHVFENVVTLNLQNHIFAQMNTTSGGDSAALRRQSTVTPDVVSLENSELFFYHNDHLGTPQVLTDVTQAVVWEGRSSPFGEVTTLVASSVENNLRFAGQYFDSESGLHYNYHRYYDPSLGRYITSDPIGLEGGLNTYAYVGSNPIIRIDPTGELWFLAPILLGGGTTVAGGTAASGIGVGTALAGGVVMAAILSTPGDTAESCPVDKKDIRTCKLQIQRPSTKWDWVPEGRVQCTWECKDSFGITKITRIVDGDTCPEVPDGELAPGDHG